MLPLKDNVPTLRFPIVTVLLILLNAATFVWELTLPTDQATSPAFERVGISKRDQALLEYGAITYRLTHPGEDCGVTGHGGSSTKLVCQGQASYRDADASGDLAKLGGPPSFARSPLASASR